VDKAILDVVEFIDVLHNFLTFFLYKVLDKSVSANGNPKAKVAVVYKGLWGEQRTEVCEGGMSIDQALCGRVRLTYSRSCDLRHTNEKCQTGVCVCLLLQYQLQSCSRVFITAVPV
jgi:hypothetical protein